MKKSTIVEAIIILFVILFLYTGINKIIDYSIFKEQIATSPILVSLSKPIALSIPWIEFSITVLLIIPRWRLKGLYASLGLMSLFTCYISGIMLFNKELPCSCGGVIELMSWGQHIIFNSVFIALAVVAIVLARKMKRAEKDELSFIAKRNLSVQ